MVYIVHFSFNFQNAVVLQNNYRVAGNGHNPRTLFIIVIVRLIGPPIAAGHRGQFMFSDF